MLYPVFGKILAVVADKSTAFVFQWVKKKFMWKISEWKVLIYTVSALGAFKEKVYEDPFLALSNWNSLDADPCEWSGISCSTARDHVIKL